MECRDSRYYVLANWMDGCNIVHKCQLTQLQYMSALSVFERQQRQWRRAYTQPKKFLVRVYCIVIDESIDTAALTRGACKSWILNSCQQVAQLLAEILPQELGDGGVAQYCDRPLQLVV